MEDNIKILKSSTTEKINQYQLGRKATKVFLGEREINFQIFINFKETVKRKKTLSDLMGNIFYHFRMKIIPGIYLQMYVCSKYVEDLQIDRTSQRIYFLPSS